MRDAGKSARKRKDERDEKLRAKRIVSLREFIVTGVPERGRRAAETSCRRIKDAHPPSRCWQISEGCRSEDIVL